MVLAFFGEQRREEELMELLRTSEEHGTDNEDMERMLQEHGFSYKVRKNATLHQLKRVLRSGIPVIVNYVEHEENEGHYAVVVGYDDESIILHDPLHGEGFTLSLAEFEKRWHSTFTEVPYKHWFLAITGPKKS
jgi:predicted double-glycine peptidase